jgi:hypothetical protein
VFYPLRHRPRHAFDPKGEATGRFAAFGVLAVALATLVEYLSEVDLGIDQWLFRDPDTPNAYAAKAQGRNRYAFYTEALSVRAGERLAVE